MSVSQPASPEPRSTRALLIRNPVARKRLDDQRLAQIVTVAERAGWQMDVVATERAGHATELARAAAERGIDVVIVHGGDGTLNDAVNGLAGSETAVAVLRGGTANVWAKETQCAKDPVESMQAIVTGRRRRVDLGRANGRYFLLMCGVGLDAEIVPRIGDGMKRRFGAAAYLFAGVAAAFKTRPWRVRMAIDGDESESSLYWLLAGNTRSYGGVISLTHRAVADDGLLEIALMRRGGVFHLLVDGVRALVHRLERSPNVRCTRARRVEITTPGIPLQVDGEPHGETPVVIECVPLALVVVVPEALDSPLFEKAHSKHRGALP